MRQPTKKTFERGDTYGLARAMYRRIVRRLSHRFILSRKRPTRSQVAGFVMVVPPTVFHPKIFLTSAFFAEFVLGLDLRGKSFVEIGAGSGILSLSAAKAGAISVTALDINPAAVEAT